MKKYVLATVLLLTAGFFAFSDSMTDWNWDYYNLAFSVPSGWRATENSETTFMASSSDNMITMTIMPWNDASLTSIDVAYAALDYTETWGWYSADLIEEDEVPLDDYSGYEVYLLYGDALKDGKSLYYVILGMIDADSDVNLCAIISWWDAGIHNEIYEDYALDIATSITKMGY